jgi:predicted alpha/beta superfamily hydrolase
VNDVHGAQLPEFFERDAMPWVASRYRVLTGPTNTALWGDSYAGSAAIYLAIQRPDLFDRMIIESPSVQPGNGRLLRDSTSLTNVPHRIALGIGTAEALESEFPGAARLNAAWIRAVHTLAENLKTAVFTPAQVQLTVADGAHHSTGDFGKRFAAGLLFIYAPNK